MMLLSESFLIAETVDVKFHGSVEISSFDCKWITNSSVVTRLCYDAANQYGIVNLNGNYYHYCEIPPAVISSWKNASSMGKYYNSYVKGNYDCRKAVIPQYQIQHF